MVLFRSTVERLFGYKNLSESCSFCDTKFKLYKGFRVGEGWTSGWSEAKDMCEECLAERLGVRVAKSRIVPSEFGLFAATCFSPGDFIVPCCGIKKSAAQVIRENGVLSTKYGIELGDNQSIDSPHPMYHGVARYANDVRPFSAKSQVNSMVKNFVSGGKQWGASFEWPALFATKKIFPGEEITLSYGRLYWEVWAPKIKITKRAA